jgi:transposase
MVETKGNKEHSEKSPSMSKEMEIGFHQGSINTLLNERNGLVNIISQIENIIQAHIKRLGELGIKVRTGSEKKE